jgi:hypothetical protein
MREHVKIGDFHLGNATYGKPVTVGPSHERGLGLFMVEPVKAGTLLLCEKADAYEAAGGAASRRTTERAAGRKPSALQTN